MRTYDRIAELPVRIDSYSLAGLEHPNPDWTRRTTLVVLQGGGMEGVGEDPNYQPDEQIAFQAAGAVLPIAGDFTLRQLAGLLDDLPVFDGEPMYPGCEDYRRWAFESAALDLALRQSGRNLADALGMHPRPVRFVVSMTMNGPHNLARLDQVLAAHPGLGAKVDASPAWSDDLIAHLAATGAVAVVDFKGAYHGTPVDQDADPDLYRRVLEAFPDVLIEDPHPDPEIVEILEPHQARVTWDANLHAVADIEALAVAPETVNFKPSRFGPLERLFDAYDYCAERGIAVYGGGQYELGVGRDHIQILASLFHPDASNDVAPAAYNTVDSFAGLPDSPLSPDLAATGFRRTA